MEDNNHIKEDSNLRFSQQISKDKLSFLKIGSSFSNNKDEKETFKKRAADYFDLSDEENKIKQDTKEQNLAQVNDEISDFSDSGQNIKDIACANIKKTFKIKEKENKSDRFAKQFMLTVEDPSNYNYFQTSKIEIYNAHDILNKANNILSKKRKRKFYRNFELKYLMFKDIDVTFTFESIPRRENYEYGSFLAKDVPLFFRVTESHILGIRNKKLSKQILKELNMMINQSSSIKQKKLVRYFDKIVSKQNLVGEKIQSNPFNHIDFSSDFVPIIHKPIIFDTIDPQSILDKKIDYNMINDEKTKLFLERNKFFNQKLAEEPTNLKLWLQFIKFQDETNPCKTENQKLDRTLTILDKCLKNKENETNLYLNILYLRIFEEFCEGKFEKINQMWITKFNLLSHESFFLKEYLNFLKYNKLLNMNKLRDHYLFIIKYYEAMLENSTDSYFKQLYTKYIIDVKINYICWESEAGFNENSYNTLRSVIETKVLQIKKIFKGNTIPIDYANYFESDFPKIGDINNVLGFFDYSQKKKYDFQLFSSNDFLDRFKVNKVLDLDEEKIKELDINYINIISWTENEIKNKNYRPFNISYDKEILLNKPESFMFYSDIKEYLNIKIVLNTDSLLYMVYKMWNFIKIDNYPFTCLSCQDYNKIYLLWKNTEMISFFDKHMIYGTYRVKNIQKSEAFYRLLDYIENMGLITDDIILMKIDLFMVSDRFKDNRFVLTKTLLKDHSNNIKLWLSYYHWCLYFEKYDEADKIINVLYKNEKNIQNISLNSMFFSCLLRHYCLYNILMIHNYSVENIANLSDIIVDYLLNDFNKSQISQASNLTRISNIIKLEKMLFNKNPQDTNSLDENKKDINYFLLIIEVLMINSVINPDFKDSTYSLHNILTKKFSLFSIYGDILEKEIPTSKNACGHLIKQMLSLIFLRTLELVKKLDPYYSPIKNTEILENLNNFCGNDNDLLIFLYAYHINKFSNVMDRDIRFLNNFNENYSLKHGFYLILNKLKKTEEKISLDYLLSSWKEIWKTYIKNLQKLSFGLESFDKTKELIEQKKFTFKVNARCNPLLFYNFWKELLKLIDAQCENIQKLNKIVEYSLFINHEYSYNKESYLNFIKIVIKYITDEKNKRFLEDFLKNNEDSTDIQENKLLKEIKRIYDIIETKEIRITENLELE